MAFVLPGPAAWVLALPYSGHLTSAPYVPYALSPLSSLHLTLYHSARQHTKAHGPSLGPSHLQGSSPSSPPNLSAPSTPRSQLARTAELEAAVPGAQIVVVNVRLVKVGG